MLFERCEWWPRLIDIRGVELEGAKADSHRGRGEVWRWMLALQSGGLLAVSSMKNPRIRISWGGLFPFFFAVAAEISEADDHLTRDPAKHR
mmetsp:Transcript_29577/g.114138  ORF Transcript_29577/g.114138 Transcript_29577/m.114138 type:complete len:91 (+) Transcript_29577:201-473(+)